jgi:hypothetical protein
MMWMQNIRLFVHDVCHLVLPQKRVAQTFGIVGVLVFPK